MPLLSSEYVMPDLATTNLLLGIMAAVSVLEALAVIGCCLAVFLVCRQVVRVVRNIEERQVAPAAARVNAILDDVSNVTSSARHSAERMDGLLHWCTRFMPTLTPRSPKT
jgi:hypothetical protein